MPDSQVSNLIKRARNSNGITQQELANSCDIDVTYLSKIENGHVLPSKKLIPKLSGILNIDADELKGLCGYVLLESQSQQVVIAQREKITQLAQENEQLKSEVQRLKGVLKEIKNLLP